MATMRSRTVWLTYQKEFPTLRLERVDVTDPAIHAVGPYEFRREYASGEQLVLATLTRMELEHLSRMIAAELAR